MKARVPLQIWDELTPADFAALPPDQRGRILEWGRNLADAVVKYAVKILIGPSLARFPDAEINHASGVILELQTGYVLATAEHVIAGYENKLAANSNVIFQAGNANLRPDVSAIWRDADPDVALIKLRESERDLIPAEAFDARNDWPPVLPDKEMWLTFVGYPVEFRKRPQPETVELAPMGGLMRVTSRGVGNLKCTFKRDVLVPVYGGYVPPATTEFGGMSGGPAFYMYGDTPVVARLITDHNPGSIHSGLADSTPFITTC